MKKRGFLAACCLGALLFGACAASQPEQSEIPGHSEHSHVHETVSERHWDMHVSLAEPPYLSLRDPNMAVQIEYVTPIPFTDAYEQADLCVTVRIQDLESTHYYGEGKMSFGVSFFSAEILETHKNAIGFAGTELLLLQLGTPEVPDRDLFVPGETLLVNLQRSDSNDAGRYSLDQEYFSIINGDALGTIRLVGYQDEIYAVDLSLTPYVLHSGQPAAVSKVDDEISLAVRTLLFGAEAAADERHTYAQKDVFRYDDLVEYLNGLQ